MNRQQQSPQATYQGRPLVRPDDEIVDQGLGFDVDTLMGRCRMLRTLGLGVAAIELAACGSNAVSGPTSSVADTWFGYLRFGHLRCRYLRRRYFRGRFLRGQFLRGRQRVGQYGSIVGGDPRRDGGALSGRRFVATGYSVTLAVGVDTTTAPAAVGAGGRPGGPGGMPPGR